MNSIAAPAYDKVLVDRICDAIARRNGLSDDEREVFKSDVHDRLIENDFAVLRKFQGRSSLSTYLTAVIANFFRDYRNEKWGRWRVSAEARRRGAVAMRLETLRYRDGYSVREAIAVLRSQGVEESEQQLHELAASLPARIRARSVDDTAAAVLPSTSSADAAVVERERAELREQVMTAIEDGLASLPAEDQTIMRLVYFEAFRKVDAARTLRLEPKPVYERIDANLRRLKSLLEARGIDRERFRELLPEHVD